MAVETKWSQPGAAVPHISESREMLKSSRTTKERAFSGSPSALCFRLCLLSALLCIHPAGAQPEPLLLENPDAGDYVGRLGSALAIDGDILIAGASFSSPSGLIYAGVARAYIKDELGNWLFEAALSPNDAHEYGGFGYSVSLSGNSAVIGLYVFVRDQAGVWRQQAKPHSE